MTRNELVKKIEDAFEMVIVINDKRFTITDENEQGISIAEWNRLETEQYFSDANDLVDKYIINGKALKDQTDDIKIQDYTGI